MVGPAGPTPLLAGAPLSSPRHILLLLPHSLIPGPESSTFALFQL